MFSGLDAVYPNTRKVKCGDKMQFNAFLRTEGREINISEIPREAFVVFVPADIPGMRDANGFGSGGDHLKPLLRLALGLGVDTKAPVFIQIDFLDGGRAI